MKLFINLSSRRQPANQQLIGICLMSAILFCCCFLGFQVNAYLKDRRLISVYRSQVTELQQALQGQTPAPLNTGELAKKREAYDRAQALLKKDAFRWTTLFDRMEELLPKGVSLNSFAPDYEKDSLLISGVAKDLKGLQRLLDNLYKGAFDQVYLKRQGEVSLEDPQGRKRTALAFSIDLRGRLR